MGLEAVIALDRTQARSYCLFGSEGVRFLIDIVRILSSGGSEKVEKNKACPKVNLCEKQNTQGSLEVHNSLILIFAPKMH